jgi:phosphopantothenoylcysteine decarboxylase/phosphopantothenate--cysteine ligase
MAAEVLARAGEQDIIIKTAAVADFRPADPKTEKIKKQDGGASSAIELERTQDILSYLGEHKKPGQFICGFSMETEHMLENSKAKQEKKKVDLKVEGAGFGTDTNVVTLITKDDCKELAIMSKAEVAEAVISEIVARTSA